MLHRTKPTFEGGAGGCENELPNGMNWLRHELPCGA